MVTFPSGMRGRAIVLFNVKDCDVLYQCFLIVNLISFTSLIPTAFYMQSAWESHTSLDTCIGPNINRFYSTFLR